MAGDGWWCSICLYYADLYLYLRCVGFYVYVWWVDGGGGIKSLCGRFCGIFYQNWIKMGIVA